MRHSGQEGTGVMCSRSNQHNDDTTEYRSSQKSTPIFTLKQHTETHAAEPYECDPSEYQTALEHMTTHTREEPYECDQCCS